MNFKLLTVVGIAGGLIGVGYIPIPVENLQLTLLYRQFSTDKVEPELLRAIAIVESGENVAAYNPDDPSYGLMQILWTGSNHLNVVGWPPTSAEALYNPAYNIQIGSQILDWNITTYGFMKGIIIYNNWSAREGIIPINSIKYFLKVFVTYMRLKYAG